MLCLALWALPAWADPSLMVSPTRVVFDSTKRTVVLTLLNNGTQAGTYRLSLVHYRMTEVGGFEQVTDLAEEERAIDAMIRFTPRQVVLPPKQSQVVRVQLRLPNDLAAGEYRTHLLFRVLPTVKEAGPEALKADGLSIRLVPAVGVSIPLIVRQGPVTASAGITDLALLPPQAGRARLALNLRRQGVASVYGNVVAVFTPRGGAPREVGRANGVAVYPPNGLRKAILPLSLPPEALRAGSLEVRYEEPGESGHELARARLPLP